MARTGTPRPWKLQAVQSAKDKLWYLRLSAGNGEIAMRSKGITSLLGAEVLAEHIRMAEILVRPEAASIDVPTGVWFCQPWLSLVDDLWYVRLVSKESVLCMWSEGYSRKDAAQRACRRLQTAMVVICPPQALRK